MDLKREYYSMSGEHIRIFDGPIAKDELQEGDEISLHIGEFWLVAKVLANNGVIGAEETIMLDVSLKVAGVERYIGTHALRNTLINDPDLPRRKPFPMGADFVSNIERQGIDVSGLPLLELSNGRVHGGTPAVIRRGDV